MEQINHQAEQISLLLSCHVYLFPLHPCSHIQFLSFSPSRTHTECRWANRNGNKELLIDLFYSLECRGERYSRCDANNYIVCVRVCLCRTTHLALCAWLCLYTAAWSPECVVSWGWQSVLNTGHSDSDFIPINEALSLSMFTYLHHCSAGPAWTTWSWDSTALLGGCGVYF